ncbi:MAG: hypothetical protein KIT44_04045 [Opitutaceae bacterium]|nr:hypothetical protein [Opitutaceae bacterium]
MRIMMLGLLCGMLLAVPLAARERSFEVTFRVLDDVGQPVAGAKTGIAYERLGYRKPSERFGLAYGSSDENGLVTLQGKTAAYQIAYGAERAGHYPVSSLYHRFTGSTWRRWQPWNPTIEVVLKRIRNPVPMYARRVSASLPKLDEPVGYDFMAGDWVAPYGRGQNTDMVFRGKLRQGGDRDFDWELLVTFSNPGDGLQRFSPGPDHAAFRSDYAAPEEGYLAEWKLRRWREGPAVREQTTFDHKAGYYFRVRTVLDEDGKVKQALYGKIYGDFFDLTYYLNPDGTRNVEYDPQRNLLRPAGSRDRAYDLAP